MEQFLLCVTTVNMSPSSLTSLVVSLVVVVLSRSFGSVMHLSSLQFKHPVYSDKVCIEERFHLLYKLSKTI